MKKTISLLALLILFSCGKENVIPTDFTFNYNIHSSLPSEWESEFYTIMNNLDDKIKILPKDYSYEMDIYAWNSTADKPYKDQIGDDGGAMISGNRRAINGKYMVLEIPASEFDNDQMHRYSVIAHEYFHVYQMSLSKTFYDHDIELKWMSEGGATTIESMYIQQYYNYNYFKWDINDVNIAVVNTPSIYETYAASSDKDRNYSSSVFMLLALSKELQKLNYSEEEAFKMIFKDFWLPNPTDGNWKSNFEDIFSITVPDFYQSLSNYDLNADGTIDSTDLNSVLPSETILLQDIFTN
ncbi:MAG: Uncharacterised protein [Owenweeksia sp. TMED14]|nr:MAG: Uncharacterised protein [Owenweeksia sp. TMED14]